MPKLSDFKVGDWWLTRDGSVVRITQILNRKIWPIIIHTGSVRTSQGRALSGRDYSGRDLIKPLKPGSVLKVATCIYTLSFTGKRLLVGCQSISKNDAEEIFKWLGEQLGYEIEE